MRTSSSLSVISIRNRSGSQPVKKVACTCEKVQSLSTKVSECTIMRQTEKLFLSTCGLRKCAFNILQKTVYEGLMEGEIARYQLRKTYRVGWEANLRVRSNTTKCLRVSRDS